MTGILDQVGEDLASLVKQQKLPTVDLDISSPTVQGFRFVDLLLTTIFGARRSIFLIGNDIGFLNNYVNSLALLLDQPDQITKAHRLIQARMKSNILVDNDASAISLPILGKRLFRFNMDQFLSLASEGSPETWYKLFSTMVEETTEKQYILAIENIHVLFMKENREKYYYVARDFFFATRGSVPIVFIAPLSWENYSLHIEHGMFSAILRLSRPFLFTPRPKGISLNPRGLVDWENGFVFSDKS